MSTGTMLFYGGIGAAALGALLLIVQLVLMQRRKHLAKEANAYGDTVAVVASGKRKKNNTRSAGIAHEATEKLNSQEAYAETEKLSAEQKDNTEKLYAHDDSQGRTEKLERDALVVDEKTRKLTMEE